MQLKPVLFQLILIASASLALSTPALAQFGIAAGLNYEQLEEIDAGDIHGTFDAASGYHVGVFYDIGTGPLGLRIGAFYRDLGDVELTVDGIQTAVQDVQLTMFDFPIDVRLNILPIRGLDPYVFAGPVLSVPRSEDPDFNESLETLFVAGAVGGGLQLALGSATLVPEFRYGIAITDLTGDTFRIAGQDFEAVQGPRGNTVQVRLGLRF